MYEDEFEETLATDEADTLYTRAGLFGLTASHLHKQHRPVSSGHGAQRYVGYASSRQSAHDDSADRAEMARMEAEMHAEQAKVRAEEAKMARELAEQQRKAAEHERKMNAIVSRMTAAQAGIEKEARTENDETMKMYKTMEKIEQVKGKMQSLDRTISELREHTQHIQQGV